MERGRSEDLVVGLPVPEHLSCTSIECDDGRITGLEFLPARAEHDIPRTIAIEVCDARRRESPDSPEGDGPVVLRPCKEGDEQRDQTGRTQGVT